MKVFKKLDTRKKLMVIIIGVLILLGITQVTRNDGGGNKLTGTISVGDQFMNPWQKQAANAPDCSLGVKPLIEYWGDFADVDGEAEDGGLRAFTVMKPATLDWVARCGSQYPTQAAEIKQLVEYNEIHK